MKSADKQNVPALGLHTLTPLYDPLVALTTRERTFKRGLIKLAAARDGQLVLCTVRVRELAVAVAAGTAYTAFIKWLNVYVRGS